MKMMVSVVLAAELIFTGSAAAQLYCPDSKQFYPYVRSCPSLWRQMTPEKARRRQQLEIPHDKNQDNAKSAAAAAQRAAAQRAANEANIYIADDKLKKAQLRAEEDKRVAEQLERERAIEQQEEKREALAAADAEKDRRQQEKLDQAYTKESVEELIVDYPQMGNDTKIITSGYFNSLGQLGMLSGARMSTNDIYLDTSQLTRDTRLELLRCQDFFMAGCLITVWGHRGCAVTAFGEERDTAPCFIVEAIRPGPYAHPLADRMQ